MVQPRRRSSSSSATSSRSASSRGSERRRFSRPVPIYELHYTADMARVPWVAQKTRKYERQESARASPVAVRQLERQQRRTIEHVEEEPRYVVRTPATPPPPPIVSTIPPAPPLPPPVQKQPPPLPPPVFAEPRHYDEPPSEDEEEEPVWHPAPARPQTTRSSSRAPSRMSTSRTFITTTQRITTIRRTTRTSITLTRHPPVHHSCTNIPQEHHGANDRENTSTRIRTTTTPHPRSTFIRTAERTRWTSIDGPPPSPSILKRQFTPRPVEREPSPPQTHRLVSGHDSSGYVTPTHLEAARPPSPPTEVELLRRMSELSLRPLRRSPSPKRQHSPVQLEEEVQQVEILIDEHEHRPHNEVGRRISDPEPFRRPRPRRRRSQQPAAHVLQSSGVPLIENFEFARERRADPHGFDAHPQLYRKLSHQSNHSVYLRHVDDHCVDYETISPFFRADSSCDECELSGRRASEPHANQGAGTRTYVVDLQQPLRL
ncbi:hypothetical protein M3Y99_01744800 [Aphelenchoides fujianensis]|nr:hypothetical protein M3Y99_01744800 [Aphelenchoides fujianensis]